MTELKNTADENSNYNEEEDDDGEEDSTLLGDDKKKSDIKTCFNQWKLLLSGLGVIVMVSLGVIIGASFNGKKHFSDVATEKCEYEGLRLPSNVIPLRYRVFLHPNITNGKFEFSGNVRILVKTKSATNLIVLHSKNLKLEKTMVHETNDIEKIDNVPSINIARSSQCKKHEQLIIKLRKNVPANKTFVIHIEFSGHLSATVLEGFYRSSYKSKDKTTHYLATTHFEATGARMAFPCFDEPALKANFSIIMIRESAHTALSNMPIAKTETMKNNNGLVKDFFQESVKMSTYLVAFIVCDYAFLSSNTSRGIKVKVWAPKEQIDQGQFALDTAVKVLDYYETFFKVNFPLPKMDLIAIPDFSSGAMENWGLITYRLTSILYKEGESSSSNKQWVAEVVAHELAHQWFGDIVTMKWWNDLWLNEGFASFMDFVGGNHVAPQWKMMDQFVLRYVQNALVLDSHINSHAISVPVHDPAEIHELFDSISYDKGASIIHMMQDFLGKKAFHKGLTNYLTKYKFRNAASDDLWKSLSEASGKINVKKVMDTWTLQMGYPVINIVRSSKNNELAVATQQHFIVDKISATTKLKKSKFNYKWEVPLTYHFQHDKKRKLKWFHQEDKNTSFSWNKNSGWLKANCKQIGFYRVNYDKENWNALAKQLHVDHTVLSDSDRANLFDDAFELAKAGKLSQAQALDLTTYLKKETKYIPFKSALSSISYLGSMLRGRSGYDLYKKYILQQMKPLMKKLGWKDEGTHLEKYLRATVQHAAVFYEDATSIKIAKKMFNDHRFNKKWIAPDLRSTVYLAATKYGDKNEWNYMFEKFKSSPFPSEKKKLMYSLTGTTNKAVLKSYLDMSLNISIIRSQDGSSVISSIARNPIGQDMAIKFVKDNWSILFKRYGAGSFSMGRLIKSVFGGLKTKSGLEDAKQFMKRDLGSGTRSGKRTLAIIRNHIEWLEKNEQVVVDWFQKQLVKGEEKKNGK